MVTDLTTRARVCAMAALAAVAVGVFANGGYSPAPRVAFGCAAIAALIVVVIAGGRPSPRAPVALVLVALAALGALSALWTIGPVDRTLIWALVTAGFAALVLCGTAADWTTVAAGVAVIAFVAGVEGLAGVALHEGPYAERVAGTWRPGGPFEYAPALALLQVSVLPVLIAGVRSPRRPVVVAAAAGLVVAVAVIALSGSRLGVAMGVVVAGLVLVPRRRALTVAIVVVVALVVGAVAFGPAAGRGAGAHSGVLHGRSDTWRAAVETWSDRPIGGTGADAFLVGSVRHQGGQTIVFAHDLPLELAAELGVAGLILALGLYAATARAVWRARGTTAGRLLGAAALAFPVANLLDWPWHLAGSGAVWALCLGALCAPADAAAVQQS